MHPNWDSFTIYWMEMDLTTICYLIMKSRQSKDRGCAEIVTGCCCFEQRSVQSSRGTRLAPTNPVSVDTVHKETGDPTATTAQTSCVRSDLQQTRLGRWMLSAHWLQRGICCMGWSALVEWHDLTARIVARSSSNLSQSQRNLGLSIALIS